MAFRFGNTAPNFKFPKPFYVHATSDSYFPATGEDLIDGLLSGAYWLPHSDRQITWGLANTPAIIWSDSAQKIIQSAFDAWEAVIDINFIYLGVNSTYRGDIELWGSDDSNFFKSKPPGVVAEAVFPNKSYADYFKAVNKDQKYARHAEGDIWLNLDSPVFQYGNFGSKAFQVVLHEIGHAIGLKHPHDGGLAGYTTYEAAGLAHRDSGFLTLMSYDPTSTSWEYGSAATPLPYDIIAAQEMYGANTTTNSGNSIHRLEDDGRLRTIYDVSGYDTIDGSSLQQFAFIDLSKSAYIYTGEFTTVYISVYTTIESATGSNYDDFIFGSSGNNYLRGLDGFDRIMGYGGNDIIDGGDGNDHIVAQGGSDTIDGGDGLDTVSYLLGKENYTLVNVGEYESSIVETSYSTTDIIYHVERLSFSDVNVALDITEKPGEAYRLYKAAFDRAPDLVGLGFWIAALDNGETALNMAAEFNKSAEFISLYGANNSNDDYLNLLYNNVLDRDGDAGGHAFWLGHLDAGTVTRERLLIDFSESIENKANVVELIANGIDYMPYG